jgi:hypothetical protein
MEFETSEAISSYNGEGDMFKVPNTPVKNPVSQLASNQEKENSEQGQIKSTTISSHEIQTLLEDVSKVISAADEPVILSKDTSCNENINLSGYHLSTRKGTRSTLMEQNTKDMEIFLHELLKNIDKRVTPELEDDDIGGRWIQSVYCPGIYNIDCLIFHLTPNRSLDYLEDFKEIPGYFSKCKTNHEILAAILDTTCCNQDSCSYKTIFYPHLNKPGPIFMPEYIRYLLENKRHGLSLSAAKDIVDLLCSYFSPIIDQLNLRTTEGTKITSSSINYDSDMFLEGGHDFDSIKWAHNLCICCLFMKQSKVSLQACSGNWIVNGSGKDEHDPLEKITLLGFESHVDDDVKTSMNCFSNVVNINGYRMSSFIKFPFTNYKIHPIEGMINSEIRYEVIRRKICKSSNS